MLCALIMAGGRGTRFWPLSTDEKPKQFLNLISEETMIQMTVNRLTSRIPMERIFIVTGEKYKELVKEQLPSIPDRNIIIEPIGRNTAPCIALSAMIIDKYYKNATLAVLPSDHLIEDEDRFLDILDSADKFVCDNQDAIVTLGMKPNRPETGYGYIKYDRQVNSYDDINVMKVSKFVEKPSLDKAREYIEDGKYLWNGGMFIWSIENIISLTKKHLEATYRILNDIVSSNEEHFEETLVNKYPDVENISVDYGIMEKAESIYIIPSDFGWDDVGAWGAVERYREKDERANILDNNSHCIDGANNIVYGKEKKIVLVGLEDVIVIENDNMIFVAKKDSMKNLDYIKGNL